MQPRNFHLIDFVIEHKHFMPMGIRIPTSNPGLQTFATALPQAEIFLGSLLGLNTKRWS